MAKRAKIHPISPQRRGGVGRLAEVVDGDLLIDGDLVVAGNLVVLGSTTTVETHYVGVFREREITTRWQALRLAIRGVEA